MARHGPTDLVWWLAGYDLSGAGALFEASDTLEAQTADVTPFGPTGSVKHVSPVGTVSYGLSASGWMDPAQTSLVNLLRKDAGYPWASVFGTGGRAKGAKCTIATDLRLDKYDVVASLDDLTKVSAEFFLSTGGEVVQDAVLIAHGTASGHGADSGVTPPAGFVHDFGAASDNGGLVVIMVDKSKTRWRGYSNLGIQTRDSANNSNWNFVTATQNFDRDDTLVYAVKVAAGTGTIARYFAPRFLFSGTRDSFAMDGAVSIGDTEIEVDGGTGTERIEAGDTLSIGVGVLGEDVVVASAEETSSGEWDVTLASGLTKAHADNAVLAQKGTDVEVTWVAAVARY